MGKRLIDALQSAAIVLGLALVVALSAYGLMGWSGMLAAFLTVALGATIASFLPPRLILYAYGARVLSPRELHDLQAAAGALSERAGLLATPRIWYLSNPAPQALTVGVPSNAAIMVSRGLLALLTPREQVAVIAHEIAHICNNDLRIMALADAFSRVAGIFANAGILLLLLNIPLTALEHNPVSWMTIVLLIVSPTIASLLQLALSRTREFQADATAAELMGDPEALVAALWKLEGAERNLWESRFPGRRMPDLRILRTHPLTRERVRRLGDRGNRTSVRRPLSSLSNRQ
ncbi:MULTISPECIES: zinc metalloprotease HtpX [unclassified Shinella]|uniref:zinc metalloprotease HtpX n=1 Tax=unclassified Shinella TaxID=2643062 RepID=UPI00234E6DA9|nr:MULTISPECIES: zinc metalloprotease HtpX [unclassified Shinella]MCO5148504.1 zinc metalloprotease HtpX [Shinella sp.]MDC7264577.1 M48 family metalloprotease [Shinella sp. HY16]MDC7271474.1 M48 family metalloprotease [Shinella sp. YZ44]